MPEIQILCNKILCTRKKIRRKETIVFVGVENLNGMKERKMYCMIWFSQVFSQVENY